MEAKRSPRQAKPEDTPLDTAAVARQTALKLLEYCRARGWSGYDPYDALNSRIYGALPFLHSKSVRLALTQGVKRFPVNLRPLLAVSKSPNPKGIALFLQALLKLERALPDAEIPSTEEMAGRLLSLRSPGQDHACWGYNFDWQTRTVLVPKGSPNIICTTFAANALLDAHDRVPNPEWLEAAVSAADFILGVLFRRLGPEAWFSYTPLERSKIHNANLLGAALLCRAGRVAGRSEFVSAALDAARTSVRMQREDGSWDYGEASTQRWVDHFHTGFNLTALQRVGADGGTREFEGALRRGFDFYLDHFFRDDGAPKYFHDETYPIDIHSVAQSVITLTAFDGGRGEHLPLADSVLRWALVNMRDPGGFFYFQKRRRLTVRIPFMRWSQAWMLLALAARLEIPTPAGGGV
jgi:hypothetical protein